MISLIKKEKRVDDPKLVAFLQIRSHLFSLPPSCFSSPFLLPKKRGSALWGSFALLGVGLGFQRAKKKNPIHAKKE